MKHVILGAGPAGIRELPSLDGGRCLVGRTRVIDW